MYHLRSCGDAPPWRRLRLRVIPDVLRLELRPKFIFVLLEIICLLLRAVRAVPVPPVRASNGGFKEVLSVQLVSCPLFQLRAGDL